MSSSGAQLGLFLNCYLNSYHQNFYRNITDDDLSREYLISLNTAYLKAGAEQTTLSQAKDAKV